jgi:hypothetical protein
MGHPAPPFDPRRLRPEASLNSTVIVPMPHANPAWVGRPAGSLLGTASLAQLARAAGLALDVPDAAAPAVVRAALDSPAHHQAVTVVACFGQRLAHLVATLLLPVPADPPPSLWRAAYLASWALLRTIWLGGGLIAALGPALLPHVLATLARLEASAVTVRLAPRPAELALRGVARARPRSSAPAAVLDFGHSSVKRAIALPRGGSFDLARLPDWPIADTSRTTPTDVVAEVVAVLRDTLDRGRAAHGPLDALLVASGASYVENGWPVGSRGRYAAVAAISREQLVARVRAQGEAALQLTFEHDGTAAAAGLPPLQTPSGLIMLGTSLGVGFTRGLPSQQAEPWLAGSQATASNRLCGSHQRASGASGGA